MKVYPWRKVDNQGDRKLVMKIITSTAVVFRVVGGLLSLGVASLTGMILVRRFASRNDSWVRRGGLMTLGGLLLFIILGGPAAWAGSLNDALMSFGDKVDTNPVTSLIGFIVRSIVFGFFFQGFAVMMASYVYEVTGSRYLERVLPTRSMNRRFKKNEAALVANDKPEVQSIAFGQIVDDPIPWRTGRYGMICARPFKEMGHGVIVGGNGTGKTVLAISLEYQAIEQDAAAFYIDFKASLRTLEAVKQTAAKAGKKFYSFDLGTGSKETSWYDPLDWKGTSSEKASMIVNSLQFSEDGSASYYRGQANDWLILQFDVLAEIGLYSGESSFDFLLKTTNFATMKDRISVLKGGDERQQELFVAFTEKIGTFKPENLSALRQNLSIVVNSGGERLRPQSGAPAILMSRAVEEGAVVYFGLSPSTDQVALKTLGSLILRNLGVLAGERMREVDLGNLRPVITLVDEASRLQDRAVVMDNLLATAREGEIYLWMITQSFATWPKSTVVEMNTNVQTHVAFRVQDIETAEQLVSTLDDVPVLEEMVEDRVRHRAFQGDVKERSGDARTSLTTGPFLVDAPMGLTSVENLHAYVWFTGSWTRATIEEWEPKRLKKPDTIRNDAPLVRIVFMDYETEDEPVQGSSFAELVTSADQITYNMENTTLKRTRRESLTEDDYSNIHLPGSANGGAQWGDVPAGAYSGYGPDQGIVNESGGGELSTEDEPMWSEAAGPRWDNPTGPNTNEPTAPASQNDDGLSWGEGGNDVDVDEPPQSFFYKGGSQKASASSGVTGASPQGSAPSEPEFAQDAPVEDQDGPTFAPEASATVEVDDDGIQWEVSPVSAPQASAPERSLPVPEQFTPIVDDDFAPEQSESSVPSGDDAPRQGSGDSGGQAIGAAVDGGCEQSVPPKSRAGSVQEGDDVGEGSKYTGASSHDTDPAPSEEAKSSAGVGTPKRPAGKPGVQSDQGRTPSASSTTSDTSASVMGTHEEGASAKASVDEPKAPEGQGEGAESPQKGRKPAGKTPSRNKPKAPSKKNASDDWM